MDINTSLLKGKVALCECLYEFDSLNLKQAAVHLYSIFIGSN